MLVKLRNLPEAHRAESELFRTAFAPFSLPGYRQRCWLAFSTCGSRHIPKFCFADLHRSENTARAEGIEHATASITRASQLRFPIGAQVREPNPIKGVRVSSVYPPRVGLSVLIYSAVSFQLDRYRRG